MFNPTNFLRVEPQNYEFQEAVVTRRRRPQLIKRLINLKNVLVVACNLPRPGEKHSQSYNCTSYWLKAFSCKIKISASKSDEEVFLAEVILLDGSDEETDVWELPYNIPLEYVS